MTSYKQFKKELLSNPEVKKEYDALEPEYKRIYKDLLEDRIWALVNKEAFKGLTSGDKKELAEKKLELAHIVADEIVEEAQKKQEKSQEMKRRRGRGRYGEQRLAKKVGGVVVGRSKWVHIGNTATIQINCQRPPDVVTEMFSFESKWLKNVPKNIEKVMTQAVTNCPEGLIPIAVIGDREQHQVYYIMTEHDFLELHC